MTIYFLINIKLLLISILSKTVYNMAKNLMVEKRIKNKQPLRFTTHE